MPETVVDAVMMGGSLDLQADVNRVADFMRRDSPAASPVYDQFISRHTETIASAHPRVQTIMAPLWRNGKFLSLTLERFAAQADVKTAWSLAEQALFDMTFVALGFSYGAQAEVTSSWRSYVKPLLRFSLGEIDSIKTEAGRLKNVQASLAIMGEMALRDPGAAEEVYRTFKIRNFGRYQAETLLRQLEMFRSGELRGKPTFLAMTALGDWSNAFLDLERGRFADIVPVYREFGSLEEVRDGIEHTREEAGPISTMATNAHSDGTRVSVGMGLEGEFITAESLRYPVLSVLRQKGYFTRNAKHILMACRAGRQGGFAQALSAITGFDVFASPKTSGASLQPDPRRAGRYRVIFEDCERKFSLCMGRQPPTYRNTTVMYRRGRCYPATSIDVWE